MAFTETFFRPAGLYTAPNELSAVPEGAMDRAKNVVHQDAGLVEPRRGVQSSKTWTQTASEVPELMVEGQGSALLYTTDGVHRIDPVQATTDQYGVAGDYTLGTKQPAIYVRDTYFLPNESGIFLAPGGTTFTPGSEFARGFVVTPILEAGTNDNEGVLTAANQVGLPPDSVALYRITYVYKNGDLEVEGPPSNVIRVENTDLTDSISPGFTPRYDIPDDFNLGLGGSLTLRLYRSEIVTPATGTPIPEFYQLLELADIYNPSGPTTNLLRDNTGNSSQGAALYTNPGQETATKTRAQLPYCTALSNYRDHVFAASNTSRGFLSLSFLLGKAQPLAGSSTGGITALGSAVITGMLGTSGLNPGMELKDGNNEGASAYFPYGAYIISVDSATQVTMSTTATASSAGVQPLNFCTVIEINDVDTPTDVMKLVGTNAVGNIAFNDITVSGTTYRERGYRGHNALQTGEIAQNMYAAYTDNIVPVRSGFLNLTEDLANGLVGVTEGYTIRCRTQAQAANSFVFAPVFSTNITAGVTVTSDDTSGRLRYSEPRDPLSFPELNFIQVGPVGNTIEALIDNEQYLYIFTERGLYLLSGTDEVNFRVDLLSETIKLQAPRSLQVLGQNVFAWTTLGIVRISGAQIEVISDPIRNVLEDKTRAAVSDTQTDTFAYTHAQDEQYIICFRNDTDAPEQYIWSERTKAWSQWDLPLAAATTITVDTKETTYFGLDSSFSTGIGRSGYLITDILTDRRAETLWDYYDGSFSVTISSFSGFWVTLASVANIEVGDVLYQTDTRFSQILEVDTSGVRVRVAEEKQWVPADPAFVRLGYETELRFIVGTGGNPDLLKQYSEAVYYYKDLAWSQGTATFKTDITRVNQDLTVTPAIWGTPWGTGFWGTSNPWGGTQDIEKIIRVWPPRAAQKAALFYPGIKCTSAYGFFKFMGVAHHIVPLRQRIRR